jgi:hypothetical protein
MQALSAAALAMRRTGNDCGVDGRGRGSGVLWDGGRGPAVLCTVGGQVQVCKVGVPGGRRYVPK